ncbi:hypothetical protein DWV16_12900 [Anaerotruncus sp. AF02-27]|uniref:hypothetical protein n=1 Tax=Anaerotruncus sp. AF02-27 TaxID=2292191 RepID=UPI000E4EF847|nr:hypothetical protein [Anaerotruncus sp. AF02-27]RGX54681.1 hypothetical protein DWV16_12900 [Anaerotruncus sp. AF02-27]
MLRDIPYSVLKQDARAYDIMLLRDQYGNTFSAIARDYEISAARVTQIYNHLKVKQIRLYINHIAIVSGHSGTSQIRKVFNAAYECYQDLPYACAYLEKKYRDILIEYRGREPGMPQEFIKGMPPFKPRLREEVVARVIEMREVEKASFVAIARELRMTQAKARHTYDMFYHRQVLELIKALQDQAKSKEEKDAIWEQYFRGNRTPKMRYDMLTSRSIPTADKQDDS